MKTAIERGSLATALGLAVHYLFYYLFGAPLFTEVIGEWIMARTPNTYSVLLLETMGAWAKPFALTGGLFALGFAMTVVALSWRYVAIVPVAAVYYFTFELTGLTFWLPALAALVLAAPRVEKFSPSRRRLLSAVMSSTTLAVAVEGYLRDARLAARAAKPFDLWRFVPPTDNFHRLARKAITAIGTHYTMSKLSLIHI
jgi:hypothetical protein